MFCSISITTRDTNTNCQYCIHTTIKSRTFLISCRKHLYFKDEKPFDICLLSPFSGLLEHSVKKFNRFEEIGYIECQLRRVLQVNVIIYRNQLKCRSNRIKRTSNMNIDSSACISGVPRESVSHVDQ